MTDYRPDWGVALVTAATQDALTLAELRAWLRIDGTASDTTITALLGAAVEMVERDTGQVLLSSTFKMVLDGWPGDGVIRLPRHPVTAVSEIRHRNTDGDWQVIDAADYVLANVRNPPRIGLTVGASWPPVASQIGAVEITFVAGYANPAAVPKNLTMALRLLASHWNENREAVVVGSINSELQLAYDRLIAGHRMEWIG
jgi:uncharacterized phiE125 gp8 family phage protein